MEIYEKLDIQDCPYCGGAGLLEEHKNSWYVMCMDCGSQTADIDFRTPELSEEAAEKAVHMWNIGKVLRMGVGD